MNIKDRDGNIKDVMEVIKDLQRICKRQREEIRILKQPETTGKETPFNFDELFKNFNK